MLKRKEYSICRIYLIKCILSKYKMAVYYLREAKDEWDKMTWLPLVLKISFRRTIRVIKCLTIVTIEIG